MSSTKKAKKISLIRDSEKGMYKVSQSKVNCWRKCRQEFQYKYVEFLKPKVKARPLRFGGIIHDMLEADLEGKNPFSILNKIAKANDKLFRAEQELYGNIVQDIRYVMESYFDYWDSHKAEQFVAIELNGRHSEHEFAVKIADGILAKGKIDLLASAKKLKWLGEHKTHKTFPQPEHRWRNLQSVTYIKIVDMLGIARLDGTVWDYIRSKPPTRPAILKSGEMSRAALDSLPRVVEDVIKQNKLKRAEYVDVLKKQQENQVSWFQRVYTPVSKHIIEPVFNDYISTAREMSELHGKQMERTFGRHCEWCSYRSLCGAALQGHDIDFIKEREFIIDENDYEKKDLELAD